MSWRLAPSHLRLLRKSWALLSAIRRASNLFEKASSDCAPLAVCRAIDCTVVKVFFTRWFSSSIRTLCCSSARFWWEMSTSMLTAPVILPDPSRNGVG